MKNEKQLHLNREGILRFVSAFCMLIAGYLTLFVNMDFIIEDVVFLRSVNLMNYGLPLSVVLILVLIGWLVASYHNTTFLVQYCGTKYSGFAKGEDGYITTMWLAIFDLPVIPVKSVWFPGGGKEKYAAQEPSPLDRLSMDQVVPTLFKSLMTIAIIEILFSALFYALGRYFHAGR